MTETHYQRMCVISDEYKALGLLKTKQLVEQGKEVIEIHGEENLQSQNLTEEDLLAAGAFFDYRIVTNEENYGTKRGKT